MMYGLTLVQLASVVVIALTVVGAGAAWYVKRRADREAEEEIAEATEAVEWEEDADAYAGLSGMFGDEVDDETDGEDQPETVVHHAEVVEFDAPNLRTSRFGLLGTMYHLYKTHRREQKLVDGGYVKWFKVEDAWPKPRYVKPSLRGGGVPTLKHDGGRWVFPEAAMVPDAATGLRTVVHTTGDSTPINVLYPDEDAIPPDQLEEYMTAGVSSSPPGWLSKLDLEPMDLVMYGVVGIIAFALVSQFLGG